MTSISEHPAFSAFKAYDVRGRVPDELNPDLYKRLGVAYARVLQPKTVAVGRDIRLSSPTLAASLIDGLTSQGVEVNDIGLCGTEEIYFAVGHEGLDGGLMVTASHNPADYNGLKMVRSQARPLSQETGLAAIKELTLGDEPLDGQPQPALHKTLDIHQKFIDYVLSLVDVSAMPKLKVVCNPGNGGASVVLERIRERLPIDMVIVNGEPDGSFPNGVPNPLLPERREDTRRAVIAEGADLGVAWDGDFDRCFFFDERGEFVEGYYLVALLAQRFIQRHPGATIIHDPRLTWNTLETVAACGGKAVQSPTGHAFIKQSMRQAQAIYGGEMSAHHYFQDFFYCDSGILPWLFMLELLGTSGETLSQLVGAMVARHPISGEINSRVSEPIDVILARLRSACQERFGAPLLEDKTDGLCFEYPEFRFNVRASNTEPLVRLNVESRANPQLLGQITDFLLETIRNPA